MRRKKPPKSVRGCKSRFHSEQPPQVLEPSSPSGAVVGPWVGCDKCTAPNPLAHPNPGSTAGISGLEAGTRIVGAQCPTRVPAAAEVGTRKTHPGALHVWLGCALGCPVREGARLVFTDLLPQCWMLGLPEVVSLRRCFRAFNSRAIVGVDGCWALWEQ